MDANIELNSLLMNHKSCIARLTLHKCMISRGFSAAVYTQTTDVEVEVNGLMTYDRKVIKLDESKLKKMNTEICNSLK